jgi:NAD(P)-dependent dehydrogenase (short-subunit alcohol dehydrogenase family)
MGKVIVITGTSTGLGLSLAIRLAKQGHTVYATMRNLQKKGALAKAAREAEVNLHIKQLNVQDTVSVESCINDIIASEGVIDTLINNAGSGYVRTTEQSTEEDVNWVMDVNFHGVVRCVKAVLPHMRKARQGHIMNVTSVGGLVGQPFNEFYCAAKFAVEGYTESLATYVTPSFGIKLTNVEPGGIVSEFANNIMEHISSTGGILDDEYRPILEKYMGGRTGKPREHVYQTAEEVADVIIEVMNSEEPPIRIRTSTWAETFCNLKTESDPTGHILRQRVYDEFLN